jgi:S-DNA-T family DNA segregation ATPase FtsK/SpoIIIE
VSQATRAGQLTLGDYLDRAWREGAMWSLVCAALYLLVALASYSPGDPGWSYVGQSSSVSNAGGRVGAWFADVALFLLGMFAYLLPLMVAWSGYLVFRQRAPEPETKLYWLALRWTGFLLLLVAGSALANMHLADKLQDLPNGIGGGLGLLVTEYAELVFGEAGGSLALTALFLVGFMLVTSMTPLQVVDWVGALTLAVFRAPVALLRRLGDLRLRLPGRGARADEDETDASDWDESDWYESDQNDVSADALDRDASQTRAPRRPAFEPIPFEPKGDTATDDAADAATASAAGFGVAPAAPQPAGDAMTGRARRRGSRATTDLSKLTLDDEPEDDNTDRTSFASSDGAAWSDELSPFDPALELTNRETPAPRASVPPQEPQWQRPAPVAPRVTGAHPLRRTGASEERPPIDLLDPPRKSKRAMTPEQLEFMSRELEARLKEFGVVAEVVEVHPGPVVALFELALAPGVKVSKITGLAKDIARALSKVSVRVVEVIPGKSVIGLEVPNDQREMVVLSETLGSDAYRESKSPLTIGMGTNISGEPVVADLGRMPHALIAGTTGSGKSVAINAMILSLVYKSSAEDVRLIMVDPKMLELSVYEGIPHLLTPVVTDMKEAANALRWCVGEMERRYKLMASLGVRNIAGYNRKVTEAIEAGSPIPDPTFTPPEVAFDDADLEVPTLEKLPYIVVIIDELADMMMVVGKKVEELIARLAQKARASGIHLLLATQRPSVDVLTGLIKANIPTRMAFKVSARVDSRTVLDQMGAEHLLGHGDMLYLPPGGSIPQRVHGAFVDDHEVHRVVDFLKQQGAPEYIDTILQEPGEHLPGIDPEPRGGGDVEDQDPLFDEAVQYVVESRRASISGVQRKLKIGYNRAARMVEEMERIGVVGPAETNGNREVLAPAPVE